jgi:hypothetical protein
MVIAGNSSIVSHPILSENFAYNNGQAGPGYCGTQLNTQSSGSIIGAQLTNNVLTDTRTIPTQQYGLCFVNTANQNGGHTITGNIFSGNPQAIYFTPGEIFAPNTIFHNTGSTSTIDYLDINGSASTTLFSANNVFFTQFEATSSTATSSILGYLSVGATIGGSVGNPKINANVVIIPSL